MGVDSELGQGSTLLLDQVVSCINMFILCYICAVLTDMHTCYKYQLILIGTDNVQSILPSCTWVSFYLRKTKLGYSLLGLNMI